MSDRISTKPVIEEEFSLGLFLAVVSASFAGAMGLVWWLAPAGVWAAQIGSPWWKFAAVFKNYRPRSECSF